jgi:HSF-type DNA-binding
MDNVILSFSHPVIPHSLSNLLPQSIHTILSISLAPSVPLFILLTCTFSDFLSSFLIPLLNFLPFAFLFFAFLVRNFSSFQRLLNLHGFRRSSPSMRDAYFHPLFLESQRDLVKNIVRIALPPSIEGDSAGAHAGR